MALYIGLDIGGTKLMVAGADESGTIRRRLRADTPPGLQEGLDRLNAMVAEIAQGEVVAGIGAAIGGPLEWKEGIVSPLHQPEWRDVPLKRLMEERWGCPFSVDVDTNVAALGEYFSVGVTCSHFVYITLSTGMGGGFLVNGRVERGANGAHPEIGHQSIPYRCANPAALNCECGAPDCLEALISGNGIRRIYGKPAEELTSTQWTEVAYNFGLGLRNLAALYAPDLIRVGGGVAVGGGDAFIAQAAQVMRERLFLVPAPKVELSRLGYDTALIGAITIAIHGLAE
jgi:predicted NBD/HSP70 family sugar kinase